VEVILLNVMGSAAVASAVIAGVMTARLSREIAGLPDHRSDRPPDNPDGDRSNP